MGRMTWDGHLAEIEELGRHIWEELPADVRERHQIDREKLSRDAQCHCTCGAVCPFWVAHLIDVRDHAEIYDRLQAKTHRTALETLGLDVVADALLGAEEILEVLSNRGTRGVERECNAARIWEVLNNVRAAKRQLGAR